MELVGWTAASSTRRACRGFCAFEVAPARTSRYLGQGPNTRRCPGHTDIRNSRSSHNHQWGCRFPGGEVEAQRTIYRILNELRDSALPGARADVLANQRIGIEIGAPRL